MKPLVSIIIPTLNSVDVLGNCLQSISVQDYPKNKIEILVCDGGSKDETCNLAKKFGAKVLENKLKTAEAGKVVGLRKARGEFVALVDSDNILPNKNWLNEMIEPLIKHEKAIGSEPWSYTLRKEDRFITRYCALLGMNDPFCYFLGNYDRVNLLSGCWTEVSHDEKDTGNYILATFDARGLPTIGANGTVFRTAYLKKYVRGDYLFDIDVLAATIKKEGSVNFIKVKNGIIHTFCEGDIRKFARKQRRRVRDFLYHEAKRDRDFDWKSMDIVGKNPWGMLKFILYCLTFFPLVFQAVKGYTKKADIAWFFHPLACEITLWEYGWGRITGLFSRSELSRDNWRQ